MPNVQSRAWCFTVNNYTEADEKLFKDFDKNYLAMGKEKGEEEKTPHLQGFIIWRRKYSMVQVKKLHPTAHWEAAKCKDAMNYCMKDKDYFVEDNRAQGEEAAKNDFLMTEMQRHQTQAAWDWAYGPDDGEGTMDFADIDE